MKKLISGVFTERIESFLEQKHFLGYLYDGQVNILANFSEYVSNKFPNDTLLSKQMVLEWCSRKPTEKGTTLNTRVTVLRQFAKYLVSIGEAAYIVPSGFVHCEQRQIPHIYSESEIVALWSELDKIKPDLRSPVRHFVIPAMFRTLYCCGLRPVEVRKLLIKNVDLENGTIFVAESKGHKSRIVPMPTDLIEYLSVYRKNMQIILPQTLLFFPNGQGTEYCHRQLVFIFEEFWHNTGIQIERGLQPRLYDFRHTFATHRLYQWLREGRELTAMMPYLSAYMGHGNPSETYYYIHLIPETLRNMSGKDYSDCQNLLPEVPEDE